MNIKENDRLHREIMKLMKDRVEMHNTATTEKERAEHSKAIMELSISAGVLNRRL